MAEVKTGVDQLMELVKEKKKLTVAEAAKALSVPEKTALAWVDFLVDERLLGIEYKFTTPYIFPLSERKLQEQKEEEHSLSDFKDVFMAYAKSQGMPENTLKELWREQLRRVTEKQKEHFISECQKHQITKADELYEQYLEELLNGA
jgi:predicted ArsR family transcriptional regulator